jgi:hypothetical protein
VPSVRYFADSFEECSLAFYAGCEAGEVGFGRTDEYFALECGCGCVTEGYLERVLEAE